MLVGGPRLSVVACRGPTTNIAGHQTKKRNPNGAFSASKSLHVALTDESDGDGLGGPINETNEGWYGANHPKPTAREIAFVNSIKAERCPYCGSALIAKDGGHFRNDAQSWCDLFAFAVDHHGDRRSFVKDMILLAISTRKVMRYRETMKKKPKNG